MRIAVTGATGFLGRHFVREALRRGNTVHSLLGPTGEPCPEWTGQNVRVFQLQDPERLDGDLFEVDALVHLATRGARRLERDWQSMVHANTLLPVRILERSKQAGVGSIVFAGTCLEYRGFGDLPDHPWRDGGEPSCDEKAELTSRSSYGGTKSAGWLLLRTRASSLLLGCWYLRFASMYGPDDSPEKLIMSATRAATRGEPFEMTGGEQVRDWLWVGDAVDALFAAIGTPTSGPAEPVNIGTGAGIRLSNLVQTIYRIAGADETGVRPGARPYPREEPHWLVLDPTRARSVLGWSSSVDVESGVSSLVDKESQSPCKPG